MKCVLSCWKSRYPHAVLMHQIQLPKLIHKGNRKGSWIFFSKFKYVKDVNYYMRLISSFHITISHSFQSKCDNWWWQEDRVPQEWRSVEINKINFIHSKFTVTMIFTGYKAETSDVNCPTKPWVKPLCSVFFSKKKICETQKSNGEFPKKGTL